MTASSPDPVAFDSSAVKTWLLDLQARIVAALEAADGQPFRTDAWERTPTPPSPADAGEGGYLPL